MYGDTPPQVIAIEPALLDNAAGMRLAAHALELRLRHRPVWVVVGPAPLLVAAGPGEDRVEAMRMLADDPIWQPDPRTGPAATRATQATAAVLDHHLELAGIGMPRGGLDDAHRVPRPTSLMLVAGAGLPAAAPIAAIEAASAAGVGTVHLWRRHRIGPATAEAARRAKVRLVVGLPGAAVSAR